VIPLTLLTGFLGAGKTTLLARLLQAPEMAGAAVLINEVGEAGLDHALLGRLEDEPVLMEGGCLCCALRGDLADALLGLAAREPAPCRVVVETTGLADPAPLLQTLMGDLRLLRRFRLAGVVTVVDALAGAATLEAQPEAAKQAAIADLLVLSKIDLAPAARRLALEARLAALNPEAPRLAAAHGDLPAEALLAAFPLASDARSEAVAHWLAADAAGAAPHDARIATTSLAWDTPLPWEGVAGFLEMLTRTRGESVLRVKGILDIAGEEQPVVVHGVQHVWHPPARLAGWPGGVRRSRLVVVTRDLPGAIVEDGLAAFLRAAG
jgi:G3E family GTPase